MFALAALLAQLSNSPPLKPVPGTLDVVRRLTGLQSGSKSAEPDFPFRLKVSESSRSSILELHATGAEAKSTRAYLNVLMDEYLKFKRESRVNASDRAVTSLKSEVKDLAAKLKLDQEKMYAFQMSNNVVLIQEQGSGAGSYLGLLDRQLATLRTELQLLQVVQPEQWVELAGKSRSVTPSEPAAPGEPPPKRAQPSGPNLASTADLG